MNWMTEIQLSDLDEGQKIQVTCKSCGHFRYENANLLMQQHGMEFSYLDEVARHLVCYKRGCSGAVRIALSMEGETEGFVGGLA